MVESYLQWHSGCLVFALLMLTSHAPTVSAQEETAHSLYSIVKRSREIASRAGQLQKRIGKNNKELAEIAEQMADIEEGLGVKKDKTRSLLRVISSFRFSKFAAEVSKSQNNKMSREFILESLKRVVDAKVSESKRLVEQKNILSQHREKKRRIKAILDRDQKRLVSLQFSLGRQFRDLKQALIESGNRDSIFSQLGLLKSPVQSADHGELFYEESVQALLGSGSTFGGIHYLSEPGSFVTAVWDGTVEQISEVPSLGEVVTIHHGLGVRSSYAFVERREGLNTGDLVRAGEIIAEVARINQTVINSGLYFEMTFFDEPLDLKAWLTNSTQLQANRGGL